MRMRRTLYGRAYWQDIDKQQWGVESKIFVYFMLFCAECTQV